MGRGTLIAWFALLLPLAALGQGVTVQGQITLRQLLPDGGTAPIPNASDVVVYIPDFEQPPPERATPVMKQIHKHFVPDVMAIVKGEKVRFENDDPILHNIFSTSRAAPGGQFDLGLYRGPKVSKSPSAFERTGIIEVYCDIHPEMVGTILVLPNRAYAVTGRDGRFTLKGIPPGTHVLYAWARHSEPVSVEVDLKPGKTAKVKLTVRRMPGVETHLDKYGQSYATHPKVYDSP